MSVLVTDRWAIRTWLARTALLGCMLMAAIIVTSAYLRLTTMGIGCEPWPACYGRVRPAESAAQAPSTVTSGVTIARLLHRAAAMLVAILAVLTLLLSLMREVRNRINVTLAMCVLASTVMLAAVGRMSATLLVPATGIANLLGGFGMLACFWILWLHNASRGFATTADRARKRRQRVAGCTLLLCIVQAAAGALISVSYSATLCSSLWICDGGDGLRMPSLLAAQPVDAGGKVIATPAWGGVQALHRIGGVVTAALIAWFGVWVAQSGIHRALGFGLLGLAFAEAGIGILMATHDFPVLAAMAHNAVAALLLLMLVTLAWPRFAVSREASD